MGRVVALATGWEGLATHPPPCRPAADVFLTRTEREVAIERPDAWRLYRLHDLAATSGLFQLKPRLETAETWRAGS